MTKKLISFISPSRNLDVIRGFLDNIENTVKNYAAVECLFKLDSDQIEAKSFIENEILKRPFEIKYIITPRLNGLFSLWLAWNDLFLLTSPDSYFIQPISDEIRFKTKNWDEILNKYIGYFPDHVFRLRTSSFKLNTYPDPFICNLTPDSFPMCTRQWLNLTLGFGKYCWASDVYHQFIAYYLSIGEQKYQYFNTPFYDKGIFRDVPLLDIEFDGLDFGVGVTHEIQQKRDRWTTHLWNKNLSHHEQENYCYLARRVSSYIWAKQNGLTEFKLIKNESSKTVQVVDNRNRIQREVSYKLPILKFYLKNARRKLICSTDKYFNAFKRVTIKSTNTLCRLINKLLDKISCYQENRIIHSLTRLPLPVLLKQNLEKTSHYSHQMPVEQYGRLQKNTTLFFYFISSLLQTCFTNVEKSLLSPAPGVPDQRKILSFFGEKKWPDSYHSLTNDDVEWTLSKIEEQNTYMRKLEESAHN